MLLALRSLWERLVEEQPPPPPILGVGGGAGPPSRGRRQTITPRGPRGYTVTFSGFTPATLQDEEEEQLLAMLSIDL